MIPNYLINPITHLFDQFETYSGISFTSFTTSQTPDNTFHNQPYLKQYQDKGDGQLYKYLYDPNLRFDWRFHQRIARMKYTERSNPWVTIMFNTGLKNPLTNVVSHEYPAYETLEGKTFEVKVKRDSVPINFVLISNDVNYLNSYIGSISSWWNRIVNFPYNQTLTYTNSITKTYSLVGQALNIRPQDLEKLDTESRGSLVTAAYSMDLVYFEYSIPQEGNILEEIGLQIKVVDDISLLNIAHQFDLVIE